MLINKTIYFCVGKLKDAINALPKRYNSVKLNLKNLYLSNLNTS